MDLTRIDDNPAGFGGCTRCGKCCENGGPAIHFEDKPLIEGGDLLLKHLFTIRHGEPAYDNIKGYVVPQSSDIIKIKSIPIGSTCRFYEKKVHACEIYRHRPVECRILKCWDTRDIIKLYRENRLTRFDIIGGVEGLWELVEDHQRNCSYDDVLVFINNAKQSGKKDPLLEKKVGFIVRYDLEIRSMIQQKNAIDPDILDLLFGRPVIETLSAMGLKKLHHDDKLVFSIRP